MDSFDKNLCADNSGNFPLMYKENLKRKIRQEISDLLLSRKDSNDYFIIDSFKNLYCPFLDNDIYLELIFDIQLEIEALKWATKICFYNTAMFIYLADDVPTLLNEF